MSERCWVTWCEIMFFVWFDFDRNTLNQLCCKTKLRHVPNVKTLSTGLSSACRRETNAPNRLFRLVFSARLYVIQIKWYCPLNNICWMSSPMNRCTIKSHWPLRWVTLINSSTQDVFGWHLALGRWWFKTLHAGIVIFMQHDAARMVQGGWRCSNRSSHVAAASTKESVALLHPALIIPRWLFWILECNLPAESLLLLNGF